MFNQVTLVGYVGNDVEMKFTPNGVEVATFSIATSEKRKTDKGTIDNTIWWRVTFWRQAATSITERLKKGMKVLIVGKLDKPPRTYQDRNGDWVASLEVTGETWRIVDWADKTRDKDINVNLDDEEEIPF